MSKKPEPKKDLEVIVVDDTTKAEPVPKKDGTVFNCSNLRVRTSANVHAKVLMIIEAGTAVKVDLEKSTKTFYKVIVQEHPSVLEGFCMKQFIQV